MQPLNVMQPSVSVCVLCVNSEKCVFDAKVQLPAARVKKTLRVLWTCEDLRDVCECVCVCACNFFSHSAESCKAFSIDILLSTILNNLSAVAVCLSTCTWILGIRWVVIASILRSPRALIDIIALMHNASAPIFKMHTHESRSETALRYVQHGLEYKAFWGGFKRWSQRRAFPFAYIIKRVSWILPDLITLSFAVL